MSEAEPEAEEAADVEQDEEQDDAEPTFSERVAGVDVSGAREKDPADRSDEEKEAIKVADLEEDHEVRVDEFDESEEAGEELDRLYNEEGLSLMDIGRLVGSTDATIQRKMEQHGLARRGNRNELDEDTLVEALRDLAVEHNSFDDLGEYQEAAEAGEATEPTTTLMTEQGPHSAHTYYNYWDSWADAVAAAGLEVADVEDDEDDDGDDDESDE